ncbi:MAG: hypothetical protein RI897_3122 [Verrucomicrobiota bacterium]
MAGLEVMRGEVHPGYGQRGEAFPAFVPRALEHTAGAEDPIDWCERGAGEVCLAWLAGDAIDSDFHFQVSESGGSWGGTCAGHGVGGVHEAARGAGGVDNPEESG